MLADETARTLRVELAALVARPVCRNTRVAVLIADVMLQRCTLFVAAARKRARLTPVVATLDRLARKTRADALVVVDTWNVVAEAEVVLAGEALTAVCVLVARVQKRLTVVVLTVFEASTLEVVVALACLLLTHALKVAELVERRTLLVGLAAATLDATAPVRRVALVPDGTVPIGRTLRSLRFTLAADALVLNVLRRRIVQHHVSLRDAVFICCTLWFDAFTAEARIAELLELAMRCVRAPLDLFLAALVLRAGVIRWTIFIDPTIRNRRQTLATDTALLTLASTVVTAVRWKLHAAEVLVALEAVVAVRALSRVALLRVFHTLVILAVMTARLVMRSPHAVITEVLPAVASRNEQLRRVRKAHVAIAKNEAAAVRVRRAVVVLRRVFEVALALRLRAVGVDSTQARLRYANLAVRAEFLRSAVVVRVALARWLRRRQTVAAGL